MAPLLVFGAALGGAAMYFFDPDHGRRRRALMRDQAIRAQSNVREFVESGTQDLRNRGATVAGRARGMLNRRSPTDAVLVERVRSKMGRFVAHPGAVDVSATDGEVTLRGSILAHEHTEFVDAVSTVSGVKSVRDELSVYKTARGISELQGEGRAAREPRGREDWAPGPRLLASAGAMTLGLYALRRHGLLRFLALAAGTALFVRTTTNKPLRIVAGRGGYKAIDIQKSIRIDAPVEAVFEFLANYENFPQFMRNVRSVQILPDGRSHWTVAGPLGAPVEWDAITTRVEPNKLIEWSTIEGSIVEHAGTIRVTPYGDGGTRVHVRMSYNPPAGALGHVVAKLFGADPKSEMDEDLARLKSRLETGRAAQGAVDQRRAQNSSIGMPAIT